MHEMDIRSMQKVELNLLLILKRICENNGLRYYIDGGTLLGAVCYEGFIPWDDDIDIKMPRPDYDKLLKLQDQLPEYVRIQSPNKKSCDYIMAKMVDTRTLLLDSNQLITKETGVYIDIFPMDGYPNGKWIRKYHLRKLNRLNSLFHNALYGFNRYTNSDKIHKRLKGFIYAHLYTPWKLYKKLERNARKFKYDKSTDVGLLVEGDAFKERFSRSGLDNSVALEFEGHMFPATSTYKEHLVAFYGEHVIRPECYHNLPQYPSQHKHKVYWID